MSDDILEEEDVQEDIEVALDDIDDEIVGVDTCSEKAALRRRIEELRERKRREVDLYDDTYD